MTAAPSTTTQPATIAPATIAPATIAPATIAPATIAPAPGPGPAPGAARAACTMRMAPRREPSFDDELPLRHLSLIRAPAAPELPFPTPVPTRSRPSRRLTLVPDPGPTPDPPGAITRRSGSGSTPATTQPGASRPPTSTNGLRTCPDPSRFGRQFAQGVIEVLSGRRPMVQLIHHVSPAVQRGLTRAGAGHQLRSDTAPVLHSVHLSEPADGVCEMSAIVVVGPRYRALAARLEWRSDRWRCTALQVG